jgi:hypothetical protein
VRDPEIPVNIVDLGLVYRLDVDDDGAVEVDMTLTSMGCPVQDMIQADVELACMKVDGVSQGRGRVRLVAAVVDRQDDRRRQEADAHVRLPRLRCRTVPSRPRALGDPGRGTHGRTCGSVRPPPPPDPRRSLGAFAAALEAQSASAAAERLRASSTSTTPSCATRTSCAGPASPASTSSTSCAGAPAPAGEVVRWSGWALVRSDRPAVAGLVPGGAAARGGARVARGEPDRGHPRRPGGLARGRRRAGGARARSGAARALLTPAVTEVLQRMVAAGPGAAVVVGERHLLAHVDVEEGTIPARAAAGDDLLGARRCCRGRRPSRSRRTTSSMPEPG